MNKDRLPQGNNIRQLLAKSSITDSSINAFLRSKGVFLGLGEKNNSVPLLMKTLVSPEDFEILYDIQKSKEESIKHRTARIKCKKDFNLIDVLSEKIDMNRAILEAHTYRPAFKVLGDPGFFIEEDGSARLDYKIERENVLNDWTDNKTYHAGSIRITKDNTGNVDISIQQNSTSKETFVVNNLLLNHVKSQFEKESLIDNEETFSSIRFCDFTNRNRIKFLYAFIKDLTIYTKFHSVTDINIYLDPVIEGSEDLDKFLKEIENLRLKGKALQNHVFMNSTDYHDKLQFAAVNLKYELDFMGVKGSMYLYLSFPDYIKRRVDSAEFQVEINLSLGRITKKSTTESQIRKKILEFVEKLKMMKYDEFKV